MFLNRLVVGGLVVAAAVVGCQSSFGYAANPLVIDQHGIHAVVGTTDVLTLRVDGVAFSEGQELAHMWPRWAGVFYEFRRDTTMPLTLKKEVLDGDRQVASFQMRAQGDEFRGEQRFEFGPGRKLKISVNCESTTSGDSILEHQICALNPAWFAGREFKVANRDGSTSHGVVPIAPPDVERWQLAMADNFTAYEIDTPTGPLRIETEGSPVRMLDYRRNPTATAVPFVWFGVMGHDFAPGAKEHYSVTFTFPPPVKVTTKSDTLFAAQTTATKEAITDQVYEDRVIPTPKHIEFSKGNLTLSEAKHKIGFLTLTDAAAVEEIADRLRNHVADSFNVELEVVPVAKAAAAKFSGVVLHLNPVSSAITPDGYHLTANETHVTIEANTTEGLLNGTRTLRQLLRPANVENAVQVRHAVVRDYPSMPWRGIHFCTGKEAFPEQSKLIKQVMGDMKLNKLVYGIPFIEWTSRPELVKPLIAMSMQELLGIKAACDAELIELIPAIPTYGLKEWNRYEWVKGGLIGEPVHGQWNNPPEQEAVEAVVEEAIKLLKPKMMLICHDELHVPKEEVLASIKHWNKFLGDRGVRTAIWGDLFLAPGEGADATNAKSQEEAEWMRNELPRDVFMMDWHYADVPPEKFNSLKIWNDLGIDTVGGTGNTPSNILPFAKAIMHERKTNEKAAGKSEGILVTTWAGRDFNLAAMEKSISALQSYVLGAEAAWVGGYDKLSQVPFDYIAAFENIWRMKVLPPGATSGWMVDLHGGAAEAHVSLVRTAGEPWLGYATGDDLSAMPVGEHRFGRFLFHLNDDRTALLVPGSFDANSGAVSARAIDVKLDGQKADVLNFAVAATRNNPPTSAIAHTTVIYKDGTQTTFDWVVGKNVYSLDDMRSSVVAPEIWTTGGKGANHKAVHAYSWSNPHPGKSIAGLQFKSALGGAGLLVFAITGIE